MDFGVACDKNSYQVGPEANSVGLGNCNLRYGNLSEFAAIYVDHTVKEKPFRRWMNVLWTQERSSYYLLGEVFPKRSLRKNNQPRNRDDTSGVTFKCSFNRFDNFLQILIQLSTHVFRPFSFCLI